MGLIRAMNIDREKHTIINHSNFKLSSKAHICLQAHLTVTVICNMCHMLLQQYGHLGPNEVDIIYLKLTSWIWCFTLEMQYEIYLMSELRIDLIVL